MAKIGLANLSPEERSRIAAMGGASRKGHKAWNAGKGRGWIDKRGYQWICFTVNGKRKQMRMHRFVMQEHLGRPLDPWEVVHHRDGNKLNNDIENLVLTTHDEHTIGHHVGKKRPEATKKAIEVFSQLREEIKHLRLIKTDLLEACKFAKQCAAGPIPGMTLNDAAIKVREMLDAAIAKAEAQ